MKKKVLFIAGPTASGKTQTSVYLAKQLNGEIISADSMQIYKGMDIGTAKATPTERSGVPHYMLDCLTPDQPCNVSWFKEQVKMHIDEISNRRKLPIVVGGTGFYLNAILFDTDFKKEEKDEAYEQSLLMLLAQNGKAALHQKLQEVDPESAKAIHPNNAQRILRALMYYHEFHAPISCHNHLEKEKRATNQSPYDYTFTVLSMPRDLLYTRINQRVDEMINLGLVEEVRYFFEKGYDEQCTAMKAIGYKEFFPYFRGEASLEVCIEKLKQATRHYAKRQLTWFRHQTTPIMIDVAALHFDTTQIASEICKNFNV